MYEKTAEGKILAHRQEWDDETLEQLQKNENIIYKREWCTPIKINFDNDTIEIGWEDDGQIGFNKPYLTVHKHWIPSIIEGLQTALRIINNEEN